MSKIAKLSTLLFLLVAQMSVAFAGTPNDTIATFFEGQWLVKLANDEVKIVKVTQLPLEVLSEGTEDFNVEDFNKPMIQSLMGCTKLETFEGEKVVSSYIALIPMNEGSKEKECDGSFMAWCYCKYDGCYKSFYSPMQTQCCDPDVKVCVTPLPLIGIFYYNKNGKRLPMTLLCDAGND